MPDGKRRLKIPTQELFSKKIGAAQYARDNLYFDEGRSSRPSIFAGD